MVAVLEQRLVLMRHVQTTHVLLRNEEEGLDAKTELVKPHTEDHQKTSKQQASRTTP